MSLCLDLKVDSIVIALDRLDEPPVEVYDRNLFFKVVKAAFAKRRKTILNNLTSGELEELSRDKILEVLEISGIDPQRRGETLNIQEFATIANNMTDIYSQLKTRVTHYTIIFSYNSLTYNSY